MRFAGRDREDARLAALVQLDRGLELHEDEVDMARDEIVERGAGALVGNVR